MNIFEIIENYEEMQNEYKQAENRANKYEKEYQSLTNCGWDDQDFQTHSVGLTARHYENEMDEVEKEMEQYDNIIYRNGIAKLLVSEFKKIEIKSLVSSIDSFYNGYAYNYTEIYLQEDNIIVEIEEEEKNVYEIKEFYEWLQKDLEKWALYDGEVTEELEFLLQIIDPQYRH